MERQAQRTQSFFHANPETSGAKERQRKRGCVTYDFQGRKAPLKRADSSPQVFPSFIPCLMLKQFIEARRHKVTELNGVKINGKFFMLHMSPSLWLISHFNIQIKNLCIHGACLSICVHQPSSVIICDLKFFGKTQETQRTQ